VGFALPMYTSEQEARHAAMAAVRDDHV
jgi:hypothetical protein